MRLRKADRARKDDYVILPRDLGPMSLHRVVKVRLLNNRMTIRTIDGNEWTGERHALLWQMRPDEKPSTVLITGDARRVASTQRA